MNKFNFLLLLNFIALSVFSQKPNYFQQEVNYKIDVTLDDYNHLLLGEMVIEYTNNSPNELREIYFHLWGNAYRSKQSAFAKQQVEQQSKSLFFLEGDRENFLYAKKEDMGGYQEIGITLDRRGMSWSHDTENPDLAILKLGKRLKKGETIKIPISFTLKIPNLFSRLGHVDQAYYITQWYPKPAVYDADGWHPMPYLDLGEFYAEFGSYEVNITLPQNYYVAATGALQTESEIAFIQKRVRATNKFIAQKYPRGADRSLPLNESDEFPESSERMKTIQFKAENVHDFAWFADKRFFIQKDRVDMGEQGVIDTWAFFNKAEFHLWLDAPEYLKRSVKFYSQKVGVYPYPHMTAVSNPYATGIAMEYPMITLVDRMGDPKTLDIVLAHEVGHNWFQGILGFNERDHPWMDEGINSYFERMYTSTYYPDDENELNDFVPKLFSSKGQLGAEEFVMTCMCRENLHQKLSIPSEGMTMLNYGLGVYGKTADILEGRIPPRKMKSFFQQWKFKHPQPEDFIQHFNLENDQVFQDWMNTTKKVDYKIESVSKSDGYKLKVSNKNGIAIPFELAMISGEKKEKQTIEGFSGEKIIEIPLPKEGNDIDQFVIDDDRGIPDVNRKNNNIRTSGLFKKAEPLRLKFLGGIEDPTKTTLYWLPAIGWNNYDKTMLGLVLHNNELTPKRFDFALAPMFGTASKNLVGTGLMRLNFFPEKTMFQKISLGVSGRRYAQRYNWDHEFYDDYTKLTPQLELFFKRKSKTSTVQQSLSFRSVNISVNRGFVTLDEPDVIQRDKNNYYINELKYTYDDSRVTSPLKIEGTIHQGEDYLKIFATAEQFFPYKRKGKGVNVRAFAGAVPTFGANTKVGSAGALSLNGITSRLTVRDYMLDENLLGRTEGRGNNSIQGTGGIFAQQVFEKDAHFKTLSDFANPQDWLLSVGVTTTIPGPLPFRPYADIAVFNDFTGETVVAYSCGVSIVALKDVFEIYVPIFENSTITDGLSYQIRDTLLKRISFLLDLNELQRKGKNLAKFY